MSRVRDKPFWKDKSMNIEPITPLMVWWLPNVETSNNRPVFMRYVWNIREAMSVYTTLSDYDSYLGKLIDSNVGWLKSFEGGEWVEWHDECGNDIGEVTDTDPEY